MKKQKISTSDLGTIRQRAEKLLEKKPVPYDLQYSEIDTMKLIHELEVHQIELEMQNEELMRAKEQAESVSQKYTELYDFAPSGYVILSKEGKIIELNLIGSQMLGKERSRLKNSSFGSFVSGDTRPIFDHFLKNVFNNSTKETCEVTIQAKGISPIFVFLNGALTENGEQCVVNMVDITERRRLTEALRESEEQNRTIILDTAMDGFCLSDTQGHLLDVNDTYCRMSGYNRQELLSMSISDLETVEVAEETAIHMKKVILQGDDRFETRHRRKDGSIFDLEISIQYQPINGGRLVAFFHDITERKTAERYREMTREILQILNDPGNIQDLLKKVLTVLKTGAGFDAVGIRLQDGEDFPYFAHMGFSVDFLLTENTLVERTKDGSICRDKNGMVRLKCTCGMVISASNESVNPLLTPGGSFWTNDSLPILKIPSDKDPRLHPRNHCFHQGYASVALVPIRNKDKKVGLLQFNDRRKERFTKIIIEKLEGIASHIGTAIIRKHAEETLRESERRRVAILETAMDGFWLVGIQGNLLEVNETYCRMSGYSARELRSMNVTDLDAIEPEVDTAAHIQKVKTQGDDRFEMRHRRKDGSTFDVEVSIQYQPEGGGQFVTFIHDITERKKKEKKLHESEARYKSLFRGNYSIMLLIDPETGKIKDANPAACSYYGWSHSELCQKNISEINPIPKEQILINLQRTKEEKNNHLFFKHRLANDEMRDVEVYSGPIQFGDSTMIYAIIHDITESKQNHEALLTSERRMDALFNSVTETIMMVDIDGEIITANKTAAQRWGMPIEELFGKNVYSLTPPETQRRRAAQLEEMIATGSPVKFQDERDGFVYDLTFYPIDDPFGKIDQYVVFSSDITERKRAEEALKESEERVRYKLQSILSPEGSIADLELNDIIDSPAIQKLMDNFYELVQIPMAIIDIHGQVLVGVGWQDICTKFHRVHPESCRNCIESDVHLTQGIPDGEFKLYKCKNNMWDLATPIMIGGEHKGNLFMGQFFFDNEPVDYKLFRKQADQYGFAEKEYLEALDKAPRLNKQKLDHAKLFFLNLSHSISQLSYSNIKLAKAITQQKKVEDALRESEELLNKAQEIGHLGSWSLDLITNRLTWSDEIYRIFGLEPREFSATYEGFLDAVHPEDRDAVNLAYSSSVQNGFEGYEIEHRIIRKNTGELRYVYEKCEHIKDALGKIVGSVGMVHDITESKLISDTRRFLLQLGFSDQDEDFFESVAKYLAQCLNMDYVCIDRLEGDGLTAQTVAIFNDGKFDTNVTYALKETPCGAVVGKTICYFPENVCRLFPNDSALQELRAESYIGTTLWSFDGKPIGLIAVIGRKPLENKNLAESVLNIVALRVAGELERTKNVKELRESNQRLELAQRSSGAGIWDWDIVNKRLLWSDELYQLFGLNPLTDEVSFEIWEKMIHPDDRDIAQHRIEQAIQNKTSLNSEYRIINNDEEHWIVALGDTVYDDSDHPVRMSGICIDITKRKQAEKELRESELRLKFHFENSPLAVVEWDASFVVTQWSMEAERIFGWSREEVIGKPIESLNLIYDDDIPIVNHTMEILLSGKEHTVVNSNRNITKLGAVIDCTWYNSVLCDQYGEMTSVLSLVQDITERKVKEEVVRKLNKTLVALSKSSQAMSQSVDEADYMEQVCKIVVNDTDFAMVWIGFAEDDEAKSIRPVASAGFDDDYLETIKISWADSDIGRGPTGTAIRTGKMTMCNNMLTDPAFGPWREQALKRGYASSIVFPLKTGDKTFGAITIYSKYTESFLDDEINMLSELANDLALGITAIRLRAAHRLAEKALSKSHSELEVLVKERTHELQITNDLLLKEINIRKQHEQSLKLTEEKYRTVADFTYGWEYWLDQKDKMLYCSPSCERITGYKASAFIENPHLLHDIVHPDDLKIFQCHKDRESKALEIKNEMQYRIIRLDGTIVWIGHACQPIFDKTGNFIGNRGSNRDITYRKEMEQLLKTSNQKYKLLSENITDGIFICRNGCFEYVNKALSHIFGYDDRQLEGVKLIQLVIPDFRDELKNFLTLNTAKNQVLNIEIECLKKDFSTVFVEILLNYVASEQAIYGVAHDITEKKQIQKNIIKAIIQTEEKERSSFSKELHDGLGPLLSTIKLYLQWSERPKTNKSRIEIIQKAEHILEDALTTVKEISNKLSPHLLTYYGLTSAIQSFASRVEETSAIRISFESNIGRRLDLEIEAAIYRAVIECINNTIKYAGANNITIVLDDSESQLQLQYRDDGIGFDLTEMMTLQKGLGLFNLQNRIQTIGGKITLFSKPGQGVDYRISVNL